ncbi:hypothetical protein DV736_g581, partial [Chaetothyriales sp. CBS 134916]
MSSAITPAAAASKLFPSSNNSNYNQTPAAASFDSSSRRSNSATAATGAATGAAASKRHPHQARNNQPLKKQHKSSKKARLIDEDALAESNAMRAFNNRKGQTSITHLMNFALPPPSWNPSHHSNQHHRNQRRYHPGGLGSGYHAVDKARYVHANYRFIVSSDREYHAQAVDADVHVSWDAVLQVLGTAETQSTNCPICLSPPVAARMAKCGHMFCLPCLIRYLHSAADAAAPYPEKKARWQKCPICEDSIYISDTRPVRWFVDQGATMLQEGGDVLLKLLKREPGTTLALPRDIADQYTNRPDIPWYHVAEVMEYARFIKGGAKYMTAQYDKEVVELEAQEKEDELLYGDVNTWTRKAVAAIEDAKQRLAHLPDPADSEDTVADKQLPARGRVPNCWEEEVKAADSRSGDGSTLTNAANDDSISRAYGSANSQSVNGPRPLSRHPFYFYSALPNFLLSPLDIRILKTAFGDFAAFPSTILPRVEHISTGHVVDDELRKRAKYMAHLPSGYEVNFLECDWTDVISPVILDHFQAEIWKRRKRNADKEAREERDRLRAEKLEDDKKWASIRRRRPSVNEKSFSDTDFQPLVQPHSVGSAPSDAAIAATPPWANSRPHSSFATLASPGTSPDAPRTVWGTAAIAPVSPRLMAAPEPTEPVDDGWLQGWENDLLDDIDAVAMVESSLGEPASSKASAALAGQGSRKGKKKKITLMSTNARRGA